MIKSFFVLVALLVATQAFALTSVGFKAYSTATAVGTTCSIVGGHAGGASQVTSAFSPIPSSARVFTLGTQGFRSYSAAALPGSQVMVNCYTTVSMGAGIATNTAAFVKMFFDGSQAVMFPITTQVLYVK